MTLTFYTKTEQGRKNIMDIISYNFLFAYYFLICFWGALIRVSNFDKTYFMLKPKLINVLSHREAFTKYWEWNYHTLRKYEKVIYKFDSYLFSDHKLQLFRDAATSREKYIDPLHLTSLPYRPQAWGDKNSFTEDYWRMHFLASFQKFKLMYLMINERSRVLSHRVLYLDVFSRNTLKDTSMTAVAVGISKMY